MHCGIMMQTLPLHISIYDVVREVQKDRACFMMSWCSFVILAWLGFGCGLHLQVQGKTGRHYGEFHHLKQELQKQPLHQLMPPWNPHTDTCILMHRRSRFCHLPFSVMITSVWELPYLWMCSIASCTLSTTSMQHSRSPYSVRSDFTSEGLNVR